MRDWLTDWLRVNEWVRGERSSTTHGWSVHVDYCRLCHSSDRPAHCQRLHQHTLVTIHTQYTYWTALTAQQTQLSSVITTSLNRQSPRSTWFYSPSQILIYKKAQLSLTNPRDAKACQKLLKFDVLTTQRYRWQYCSTLVEFIFR